MISTRMLLVPPLLAGVGALVSAGGSSTGLRAFAGAAAVGVFADAAAFGAFADAAAFPAEREAAGAFAFAARGDLACERMGSICELKVISSTENELKKHRADTRRFDLTLQPLNQLGLLSSNFESLVAEHDLQLLHRQAVQTTGGFCASARPATSRCHELIWPCGANVSELGPPLEALAGRLADKGRK
jgi:hypothetical protein